MNRQIVSVTGIRFARLMAALALTALTVNPANATPDRATSIDDAPLGYTDSHLFMLRTLSDNLGSYYSTIDHVYLVKQHMQTGRVDGHWLVRVLRHDQRFEWPQDGTTPPSRIITETDRNDEGKSPVTDDMLPVARINPFDVMRREKAVPLSGLSVFEAKDSETSWKISPADGLVAVQNSSNDGTAKTTTVYSAQELKTRVTTALLSDAGEIGKASLAPGPNAGPYGPNAFDPTFDNCSIARWLSISSSIRDKSQQRNFVAIICDDDEEVGHWLTWVYIGNTD